MLAAESPLQALLHVGYDILFLYEELTQGTVFELVVCAEGGTFLSPDVACTYFFGPTAMSDVHSAGISL